MTRWDDGTGSTDPLERMTRNALILLALLVLGSALFWSWGGALSVALGGGLAWINFKWLELGVESLLGRGERPAAGPVISRFIGRLILILIGLFAIIQLSFLSLIGTLLGLSIFVLTGFVEAIYQLVREIR